MKKVKIDFKPQHQRGFGRYMDLNRSINYIIEETDFYLEFCEDNNIKLSDKEVDDIIKTNVEKFDNYIKSYSWKWV